MLRVHAICRSLGLLQGQLSSVAGRHRCVSLLLAAERHIAQIIELRAIDAVATGRDASRQVATGRDNTVEPPNLVSSSATGPDMSRQAATDIPAITRYQRIALTLFLCACLFLSSVVFAGVIPTSIRSVSNDAIMVAALLYPADVRFMEAVQPLGDGLAKQLSPVSFTWTTGPMQGQGDIGFIAQEVEQIVPEVVHTDAHGLKYVDYAKLMPILFTAVQANQVRINELKGKWRSASKRSEVTPSEIAGSYRVV